MATPSQDPTIIQGPNGPPLSAAVIGCGGTGCNILAEGELPPTGVRIALGSEPDTMVSLSSGKRMLVNPRDLERNAMVPSGALRVAASEFERELAEALEGTDIAFMLAGLGGLSGGWGAVVGARAANVSRVTGICVASVPFSVEGGSRRERARAQLEALSRVPVPAMVVPNDMILSAAPNIPFNRAFRVMNSVLASPVNLFLRSFGRDDLKALRKHLSPAVMLTMDSAEWDRENAEFAVIEMLAKSQWLDIRSRPPVAAILFVEGHALYDGLNELGRLFSRELGGDCPVLVAAAGERGRGLRVTAVVGF